MGDLADTHIANTSMAAAQQISITAANGNYQAP